MTTHRFDSHAVCASRQGLRRDPRFYRSINLIYVCLIVMGIQAGGVAPSAAFDFKAELFGPPKTLAAIVQSLDGLTGEVSINGIDTAEPSIPFDVDWGDGTPVEQAWFPFQHTYAQTTLNYIVQISSHYDGGGSNAIVLPVRFVAPELTPLDLPVEHAVFVGDSALPLTSRPYPGYPAPILSYFDATFFDIVPRSAIEYVLHLAAELQYSIADGDILDVGGGFQQHVLRDPGFGGMFSIWFTEPVAFGAGDYAFNGNLQYSSFFHEMGHNVTLDFPADFHFGGRIDGAANAIFSETMAQIFQHYTAYMILNNHVSWGLEDMLALELELSARSSMSLIRDSYDQYISNGAPFESWNNVATSEDETFGTFMALAFKFFEHAENADAYVLPLFRMMKLLGLFDADLASLYAQNDNTDEAETFRSTLMVAALSYAFDTDLRSEMQALNFPIDDEMFDQLIAFASQVWGVNCSSTDITLSTQAEVDNFQATYGGGGVCDTVTGQLKVEGGDINNLDGLANLTSVGWLNIWGNAALTNLDGLANLTSLGGLDIFSNPALTNLDGLANLTSVGDYLYIYGNASLANLDGLANLTSVGGTLIIQYNPALTNLNGLANLTSVGGDLDLLNNDALTFCYALATLLDEVDDADSGPGQPPIPDVGGAVTIGDNLPGCNSVAEVLIPSACEPQLGLSCPPSEDPQSFIGGLNVQINGGIFAPYPCEPVAKMHWDWGDGTGSDSWFPASHTYTAFENYHITVTVLDASDAAIISGSCDVSLDSTSWKLMDVNKAVSRRSHSLTYDSARNVFVLFGGRNADVLLADTWEYNGISWSLIATNDSPPARFWHSMVYDSNRQRIVLFGGGDPDNAIYFNDTWEYDGANWQQVSTPHAPPPMLVRTMVFDSARNRTVLLLGEASNETWEYDGSDWILVETLGSPPPPGALAAMAYDTARERTVLTFHDGTPQLATWEYDGSTWTELDTLNSPLGRWAHAMTYDSCRQQVVLFGGYSPYHEAGSVMDDTWEFDGTNWVQILTPESPGQSEQHAMDFDSTNCRVISNLFGYTWIYPKPYEIIFKDGFEAQDSRNNR